MWISDSTYGVVRHVIVNGEYAASFDDLNSDYREVALVLRHLRDDRWAVFYEQDDIGFPVAVGQVRYGWTDGLVWALGRDQPGTELELVYNDQAHAVAVDDSGWWLFTRPETDRPERALYELEVWLRLRPLR